LAENKTQEEIKSKELTVTLSQLLIYNPPFPITLARETYPKTEAEDNEAEKAQEYIEKMERLNSGGTE